MHSLVGVAVHEQTGNTSNRINLEIEIDDLENFEWK